MAKEAYKKQVKLLLGVLPEIAKENCFALHGGTAINLFVREMPRLSVDIDLTYVPLEDRETSLGNISDALERCKERIQKIFPKATSDHKKDNAKLHISEHEINIKIEVNTVIRGTIADPLNIELCAKAQKDFEAFCTINVVPIGQLFGGKIVAAFDRQHPRDLFDVKYLLGNEGFTDEVRKGFIFSLLSSDRPIHEVLVPNFQNQRSVLDNQFAGMTEEQFTYEEYESVRDNMVKTVYQQLTDADKKFLLSVKGLKPDWSHYDFGKFPAVKWKLQNLQKLKEQNPEKYRQQYEALEKKLSSF